IGGGLYAEGTVDIAGSEFTLNSASSLGGGVGMSEGSLTLDGCILEENQSSTGAGVGVVEGSLEITDCSFSENWTADSGGTGAGFMMLLGTVDIVGSSFEDNEARHSGGAGYVYEGSLTAKYTEFTANTAGMFAGGLFGGVAELSFDECLVEGNSARWGGGVYTVDGSVTCAGSTTTTTGFLSNRASGFGGGVYSQAILSTTCDWGSGTTDNSPEDLDLGTFSVDDLGADETFVCDEGGCE
ncbi:MAG: hypothetical protein JRI25_27830, partial [Deltaproteobacteria bacterium]|nr:hypothetical protein [Deltaproteobacteria bacterium]